MVMFCSQKWVHISQSVLIAHSMAISMAISGVPYKSHSSVWRILEVCNKRGYWTYVGIFFQKMKFQNVKFSQAVTFYQCSLKHIVLFKLIIQSQLLALTCVPCVWFTEKGKIIFLICLFQKHLQIIRISLTKKRLGRLGWMA